MPRYIVWCRDSATAYPRLRIDYHQKGASQVQSDPMTFDPIASPSMQETLKSLSADLEALGPQETLNWALQQYPKSLVLASSFGAEDMVLIDMLCQLTAHPQVFYLDTGLLFQETYTLIKETEQRYQFSAHRVVPPLSLDDQDQTHGPKLYNQNPDLCCQIRKVSPLKDYLRDKKAWITGIRRDQTLIRQGTSVVHWDTRHQLVKINPLATWSSRDVFRYLVKHHVPYNPLHDQGYPSIGCHPCTRAVQSGEDARAGRWSGEEKTECGLHL